MPLLQPTETGLRFGPDQAEMLSADQSPIVQKPSPLGTFPDFASSGAWTCDDLQAKALILDRRRK